MYYDSIVENNLPVTNPAVKLEVPAGRSGRQTHPVKALKPRRNRAPPAVVKEKMPYWYPALLTEARTGLRLGELIALPWSNVGSLLTHHYGIGRTESKRDQHDKKQENPRSRYVAAVS